MPEPSTLKEKARRAARALAVGVCLLVIDIGACLAYLSANIANGGSVGMDILAVVAVFLGLAVILIFVRLRKSIRAAMTTL